MLGGIGFTWEHDAHLYLRRAMALRQLLGGGGRWRAAAAPGRARRRSVVTSPSTCPPEAESIRAEIAAIADEIAAAPAGGATGAGWPTPG